MKLLSVGTNAKTSKSDAGGEYLTAIMYLAPAEEAGGKSLCPFSTEGCRESCLYKAGRGQQHQVQSARISKAQMFLNDKKNFMSQLTKEIMAFERRCRKLEVKPAVRLNGTSDILWEREGIIGLFPDVQFYDYTKIPGRMFDDDHIPDNYDLTFSRGELTTDTDVAFLTRNGRNVAVVFNELPEEYAGAKVINGDLHDLRFSDPKGVIVGLIAKGPARKDTSGFVVA